jgi:sigma-B regulation protein RsbU (phosphoserine phosphatase)
VDELQSAHPESIITTDFALSEPITVDPVRIGQLLSNLLGNALVHGTEGALVTVIAKADNDSFDLAVCNEGDPISAEAMERLFYPFSRGDVRESQQGLGLGLYIASEIARAHGGAINATSTPELTRFTFRMPLQKRAPKSDRP